MKKKVTHVEIRNIYPTPEGVPPRPVRKVPGGEIHEVDLEITFELTLEEMADLLDETLNAQRG